MMSLTRRPRPPDSLAFAPKAPAARRADSAVMMPKFLKELFPNLEKPNFGGEPTPVDVSEPNAALKLAGKGMSLLKPIFDVEAEVQALVLNLGSYDADEVRADIEATARSAPVVVYSYPLSPFSAQALATLRSTGADVREVALGPEWFLLGPRASATRVELRKMYGQGSLPHVFIGGQWIGGLATGADGGLAGVVERDELVPMLRKARAL